MLAKRNSRDLQHGSGVGPSILELATSAGLLSLNPSDLVFESSQLGIAYYDYILSVRQLPSIPSFCNRSGSNSNGAAPAVATQPKPRPSPAKAAPNQQTAAVTAGEDCDGVREEKAPLPPPDYQLFLAKLDSRTNVESFETALITGETLSKSQIPASELAMIIMGVLIWRQKIAKSRLLCLVNHLSDDNSVALEALKRATLKFKCLHHVLTIGSRRPSAYSNSSTGSWASYGSSSARSSISASSTEGMKLRVMMCQSRTVLSDLPAQALRETRFLLVPSSNPLLCLCFPLT